MCVVDRLTSQYWNSHLFVVCVRLKGYTCLDRRSAFLRSRNLVLLGPSAASWTQSCLSRTPGPGPKKALSLSSSASRLSHFELTRSQSLACSWDTDEDYYYYYYLILAFLTPGISGEFFGNNSTKPVSDLFSFSQKWRGLSVDVTPHRSGTPAKTAE